MDREKDVFQEMISSRPPGRVLIIKPSSLGDVIHGLPVLRALRRMWPDMELDWLIATGLEEVLHATKGIDRLVPFPKDRWKGHIIRSIPEICRFRGSVRRRRYDVVVDLQGLLRSGLVTGWTRAPRRVGFADAREGAPFFYNHRVATGSAQHAVERNMCVAEALGCTDLRVEFGLGVGEGDGVAARRMLQDAGIEGNFIVVHPGARWKSKIWPAERFGRVIAEVRRATGLSAVVTGGRADVPTAEKVCTASENLAVSLAGETSLGVLSGILGQAKMLVTNDSGPMHMAVALGTPVVAVFGPTDPAKTGPYGSGHVVLRSPRACAPCRKRECDDMGCILGVSEHDVIESVLARLGHEGR